MTVYVVNNGDSVIMGIFKKKNKAKALVQLGKKRWNEGWQLNAIKLNRVESWISMGSDSYRKRVK